MESGTGPRNGPAAGAAPTTRPDAGMASSATPYVPSLTEATGEPGMSRSLLNFKPRSLPEVKSMAQLSGRQDVASRPGAFDVLRGHA